ncbi:hypothetical protein [Planctomyces sp. SH-PL62]|uniref:hypothetical protein n=1 Tax=Planctomyces sp. SH-PL62 TaxID=1636152 RepID=UPI00078BDA07|nr:hypothetical protein [Planctomyces sp. SH-PL62]AMV40293.1 hypothetical protein VT85_22875 [Planctomyces sp. SH-PL62]
MRHGLRQILGRTCCLLAVLGLLVAAVPGCGDGGDSATGGDDAGVPPVLKKSNDQMENFMKSQREAKKK